MPWVKLHTDILGDTKLMRAARKGEKGLELLPWLFAFAGAAGDDGRLTVAGEPAEAIDIAAKIPGVKAAAVAECMFSAQRIGVLVDDGGGVLRFAAWDHRAGKPSDRPENVRERVQRHRDRKRAERAQATHVDTPASSDGIALRNASPVTPGHAIEGEEDREKREIKSGEGELSAARVTPESDSAPLAPHPADDLPPAAKRFISTFYPRGTAPPKRRADVAQQLVASLNGGVKLSRGKIVRAVTAQRLAAKCEEVIREGVDKPDAAIVVLLKKLGDVSDLGPDDEGPGAAQREQLQRDARADAHTLAEREAAAFAWAKERPGLVDEIRGRLLVEYPGDKAVEPTRRMLLVTELEKEMQRAEVPT